MTTAAKAAFFVLPKDGTFTLEDYGFDSVEVWPENWPAWRLFCEISGQWRIAGMNGVRFALDYTPLFARMERLGLSDDEWNDLFADIRVMEAAALEQMRDNET
nr:DUF1799 domain-containing protein [Pelomonas sp. V22]